jgi:hypothetical protein
MRSTPGVGVIKLFTVVINSVLLLIKVFVTIILSTQVLWRTLSFENKQNWKKVYKSTPLLAILPEGPQKKLL